jgi:hypothetical protein
VVGDRSVGCWIDGAEAAEPGSAAVFNEGDGEAGDVGLLHEAGDVAGE